PPLEGEGT
ncbi:hypothetical protein VCHC78A1_02474B, partial [Vibrio cholerae HC-78A1]